MFEFDFLKIRQRNFCKEEHWLNGFPVQWLKTEEDSYQKSKHRQGNENWNMYLQLFYMFMITNKRF